MYCSINFITDSCSAQRNVRNGFGVKQLAKFLYNTTLHICKSMKFMTPNCRHFW